MSSLRDALARFPRLDLVGAPTPLDKLERLSAQLGRELFVKRDDLTPLAMGGNKVRKLEYLAADALAAGADVLVTAGAIQSNHVRQTAALAARLGLGCLALLENPIGTDDANYLGNGNRLLLDLFGTQVEAVANLDDADALLQDACERLRAQGRKPYLVPIGGSNALGALGYVRAGLELAEQVCAGGRHFAAVVLASGSAGTHAGLALALAPASRAHQGPGPTPDRRFQRQAAVAGSAHRLPVGWECAARRAGTRTVGQCGRAHRGQSGLRAGLCGGGGNPWPLACRPRRRNGRAAGERGPGRAARAVRPSAGDVGGAGRP